jgi:HPt (histidine-containing phosphotransfer) domain-containing protein
MSAASLPAELPGLNIAAALRLLMQNETMYRELVQMFLRRYGDCSLLLQDTSLSRRVERQTTIHSLASSAAYIGANTLAHQARAIDRVMDGGQEAGEAALFEMLQSLALVIRSATNLVSDSDSVPPSP